MRQSLRRISKRGVSAENRPASIAENGGNLSSHVALLVSIFGSNGWSQRSGRLIMTASVDIVCHDLWIVVYLGGVVGGVVAGGVVAGGVVVGGVVAGAVSGGAPAGGVLAGGVLAGGVAAGVLDGA